MDVRIGVTYTAKELEVDLGDDVDRDQVVSDIQEALSRDNGMVWLEDRRGKRFGVPSAKVAWVEIGSTDEERRVGFGVD